MPSEVDAVAGDITPIIAAYNNASRANYDLDVRREELKIAQANAAAAKASHDEAIAELKAAIDEYRKAVVS